jgi:hypothetical protein
MSLNNQLIKLPNYQYGIAAGLDNKLSSIHRIGFNGDITNSSVPESIWTVGGLYPWEQFGTGEQLDIVSDSVNDDMSVYIKGLDSDYNVITEVVTLNGTTPVTTTQTFLRIEGMYVTEINNGNVTAEISGIPVCSIDLGEGQSVQCVYTVPAGHTAFLLCGDTTVNKGHDAQVRFYVRYFGGAFSVAHIAEIYEGYYRYNFPIPVKLPEKTDVDVRVLEVENSGTKVSANFDLVLEECINYQTV